MEVAILAVHCQGAPQPSNRNSGADLIASQFGPERFNTSLVSAAIDLSVRSVSLVRIPSRSCCGIRRGRI